MATANIFERASRKSLKFSFKGSIRTDDLWSLSRQELNDLYISIEKALKESQGIGLLQTKTKTSKDNELRLEIVKYVYDYKTSKEDAAKAATATKLEMERIGNLLATKREKADEGLSETELLAKFKALQNTVAVEEED